jgi:hypothetical protein
MAMRLAVAVNQSVLHPSRPSRRSRDACRPRHSQADPALPVRPPRPGHRALPRQWLQPNGYSLYSRRSNLPLARLRLTGEADEVVVLYPSHCGGWQPPGDFGTIAMPLDQALETISANPYFLQLRHNFE